MNMFKFIQKMAALVVLLLCFGGSFTVQAGEFAKLFSEGLAKEFALSAGAVERAEAALAERFGEGAVRELGELRPSMLESLRADMGEFVKTNPSFKPEAFLEKFQSSFDATIKPAIIESKGIGFPEGFAEKFNFSKAEIVGMEHGVPMVPEIQIPEGAVIKVEPTPVSNLERQFAEANVNAQNALAEWDATKQSPPSDTRAADIKAAREKFEAANQKATNIKTQLSEARTAELNSAKQEAKLSVEKINEIDRRQIYDEPEKIAELHADAVEGAELAGNREKAVEVKSAKARFEEAKDLHEQAKTNKANAEKDLKKYKEGTTEYETAEKSLKEADAKLAAAERERIDATRTWKEIEYESLNWRGKAAYKLKGFVHEVIQQLAIGTIFLVPGWVQQTFAEAQNKKALNSTLQKSQRFGKVWMTLPRHFINEENPAASLYLYVGVEEKNKNQTFTGSEKTLQQGPANLYTAAPSYGEWGSVALTDPNFPNTMAHLNTGLLFVGDGAPANTACPVLQLIGNTSKYPKCTGVLQNDKLNKLYGPINRGVAGTVAEGQFMLKASGYEGSPEIASLLDPETNQDWATFYKSIEQSMRYGALLNPAIGAFRTPTKVGSWTLQEIQGLGEGLGALVKDAKGASQKPFVAEGLWIYQASDTPRAAVVRNQLLADPARANNVGLVWDYVVALDQEGVVVPLHAVEASVNGFQQYTFNKDVTRVRYLCSLLQDGILGATKGQFMLYQIDGNKMIQSTFPSPLEKASDFQDDYNQEGSLKGQIQAMYQFIKTEMVKGPFTVGPRKLEISQELLDAKVPVYKIAGALEDGSDDYVYPTNAGGNGLMLPDDSAKFMWSLVTSRAYMPTDFSPYATEWYAGVKKDAQGNPTGVAFAGSADPSRPYKGPLATLLMPAAINPVITEDAPLDLFVAKQFAKALVDPAAPAAVKNVWDAVQQSFTRWKAYMVSEQAAGNMNAIQGATSTKTWGKSTPAIQFTATSMADIVNGFYVYTSPEYPSEYLVMSATAQFDGSTGGEFADQAYALSLSSGNVYQKTNAQGETGKLAGSLDQEALWQQLQTKVNFPKILAAQQDSARRTQMQQNFTRLDAAIKDSQGLFNARHAAEQYGNNLFGAFNFFINKKDLAAKSYFYQDVTEIQDPLSKLNAEGDISTPVDLFVFGVTTGGVTQWGYPLTGAVDRALNLATGSVYGRGGFLGEYAQLTEDSATGQLATDSFLRIVLAAVASKGMVLRQALQTNLTGLISQTVALLDAEKKVIATAEAQERAQSAKMDPNLIQNLSGAPYLKNFSNFVQKYLKQFNNKYYLAEQDSAGNIVSYTDYNVGGPGDTSVCATYHASTGAMLMRVTGWQAQNARARAGVIVAASGAQSLAIGVDQPMIPMNDMVRLATVPAGGAAQAETAALQKAYDEAVVKFKAGGDTATLIQLQADVALKKLLLESAQEFAIAITNGDVKASGGVGYEYSFNQKIGAFFCNIISSPSKSYFLDLSSGLTYDTNGVPRMRKDPLFVDKTNAQVRALAWFEGESRARQLLAVLPVAAQSNAYGMYISTVQIPPDTYVPTAGMAAVTYNGEEVIQQTSTNIADPSDDKTVVTNDYVRGKNKNIAMMDVWNLEGGKQVKIGSFSPSTTDYFAHLMYIQTRQAGAASGLFDPAAVIAGDNASAVLVWDGGGDLNFKQLYYEYSIKTAGGDTTQEGQFVTLSGSGNVYNGSFTDSQGTAHSIKVTKEQRAITTTGTPVTAMWISIQDGNTVKDYHYDTAVLEVDTLRSVKNNWGINVVADMYGQTRLALKYTSLKTPPEVTGVPSDAKDSVNEARSGIMFDPGMSRFLYKLASKVTSWGLTSYDATMQGSRVDLESGIVFGLDNYPTGRSLTMSDMHKLVTNLKVGITRDKDGKAVGLHYRNIEDVGN